MVSRPLVLLVDDDPAVGTVLSALLQQEGIDTRYLPSAEEALATLDKEPYDVVLSDIRMPGMDGVTFMKALLRLRSDLPVILLTAHGTVPLAVEAMKNGASDFLLKPFDRQEILFVVRKALVASANGGRVSEAPVAAGNMVGDSAPLREIQTLIRRAAAGTSTVLIRGESGTGKDLVARAVHDQSARADGPFVKIHCAALPDALLESELFGYEKGAFTGAANRKLGRVEHAHGGTLFLDEIGDITPALQVKLLRVLQERQFERLGGAQTIRVDVRFVAATHRNLEQMMAQGQFREDLFYRLTVVPLWLPPLRDRPGDVARLCHHFARMHGDANGKPGVVVQPDALALLTAERWPGNVRQLENFMERVIVLTDGAIITAADVGRELGRVFAQPGAPAAGSGPVITEGGTLDLGTRLRKSEREALEHALAKAGNNRTMAARLLGVSRRTLYSKLEEHGLV